jgi:hypothetical protein
VKIWSRVTKENSEIDWIQDSQLEFKHSVTAVGWSPPLIRMPHSRYIYFFIQNALLSHTKFLSLTQKCKSQRRKWKSEWSEDIAIQIFVGCWSRKWNDLTVECSWTFQHWNEEIDFKMEFIFANWSSVSLKISFVSFRCSFWIYYERDASRIFNSF